MEVLKAWHLVDCPAAVSGVFDAENLPIEESLLTKQTVLGSLQRQRLEIRDKLGPNILVLLRMDSKFLRLSLITEGATGKV
jgi:hypothetical protein